MPLALKSVPTARGAQWVRDAFRLFKRRPLAFTGLFMAFMFVALMSLFIPVIGGVLQMMMLPLLSLGFMIASLAALHDGPVQPGQFIEALGTDARRRRALLTLCGLYGLLAVGLLWGVDWLSEGKLAELQAAMAGGDATPQEIDALAGHPGVFNGMLALTLGASMLSVPFWHAPALVHWGHQGAAQALFSSTLAVWRAKGAFVVYAFTWFGLVVVFGVVSALLLGALGMAALAGVLALPAGLLFSTVFYVSLIFSFHDSFGEAVRLGAVNGEAPPEPTPSEPATLADSAPDASTDANTDATPDAAPDPGAGKAKDSDA